jgi:Fibronectin type III domain
MSNTTTQPDYLLWSRWTEKETARKPLHLTAIVFGLLLTILPFLTGCGTGEPGNQSAAGSSASLSWGPVAAPSVSGYFVHYGQRSPGQMGSCLYEDSIFVDSSSATVTNLAPNTLYYFSVSAYDGLERLESACSNEVSIVTSSAPV